MREILESGGWWKYRHCSCGGVFTQKFKHPNKPGKEIWIKPNRNTWEYRIGRPVHGRGVGIEQLKTLLESI